MKIGMEKTMIMVQGFLGADARYYILDLEEGKVMTTPFTTLANEIGLGTTTLFSGTCLYNVGGRLVKVIDDDDDDDDDINSNRHLHLGASFLELNIPHLRSWLFEQQLLGDYKWKAFPCMQHPRKNPICASLDGRLYVFGGSRKSFGEVFIPSQKVWQPLDSPETWLTTGVVDYPVLSDEKNKRLLVYYNHSLYAYYPSTGKWDLLHDGYGMFWRGLVAFADDVLYFHLGEADDPAFDLATKAWLTVKYSSEFTRDVCLLQFQEMLYLGNGVLCLVHNSIGSGKTKLTFVLYRVERILPSVLRVTPIDVKHFFFDHDLCASRYIPPRIVCCI